MKKYVKKAYWVLSSQFGINPKNLIYSMFGLPRYLKDLFKFRKQYQGKIELMPCQHDWFEEGGSKKQSIFGSIILLFLHYNLETAIIKNLDL